MITVALADDQALVRAGFRLILDVEDGIEVVGEAEDGMAAVRLAQGRLPDVLLMDIRMPVLDGIEATHEIVRLGGPTRVLILTTFDHDKSERELDVLRHVARGLSTKADRQAPGAKR